MARVLYFDCFSGISGDMALGALLDAGLPFDGLRAALGSLALGDAHVHAHKVLRAGVTATKFSVHEHAHHEHTDHDHAAHDHPGDVHGEGGDAHAGQPRAHTHAHRTLADIFHLIDHAQLSAAGRDRAKAMFQRLGEAEAAIHGIAVDRIHLHEVGALDSIIDIVGIVHAMEWVGADRIVCSALNVGGGMVHSAHGLFPVPAPATVKLLGDAPVYSGRVQKELVTPTGALIATTFATSFGAIPPMAIERVGYGAGDRDDPVTPNVVRVLIGRVVDDSEAIDRGDIGSAVTRPAAAGDRVAVIECEIDDMNPQLFGVVMDRLYAAGALEVFYTPVQMKKNRPGTLLTAVAAPDRRAQMTDVIFRETTTIGLRFYEVDRECLQREMVTVHTAVGEVRFKVARREGRVVNAVPEFDDCAAIAVARGLSVKEVQAIAIKAYGEP